MITNQRNPTETHTMQINASQTQEITSNKNKEKSSEKFLEEEKNEAATTIQEEERCKCLPNDDCPTDQKDFTFGISCKMGMVRCCISEEINDNKETVVNVTEVSTAFESENSSDATITTTTPAATTKMLVNNKLYLQVNNSQMDEMRFNMIFVVK